MEFEKNLSIVLGFDNDSCHWRHCDRSEIKPAGRLRNPRRLNARVIRGKTQKHGDRSSIRFFLRFSLPIVAPFSRSSALQLLRPWPHVTGFKPQSLTFPYVSYVLSYRTPSRARTRTHACQFSRTRARTSAT